MAIYHLSVKTISRSAGRSATAAVAYRSGKLVRDERTGLVHDYRRRHGVEHAEIVLPASAPAWAGGRETVWNAIEQAETRKNSTVAREFEVALPAELNPKERLELARGFARELAARHGIVVDVAIHAPGKDGDNRNHHAHLLCSTRRLTAEGFKEKARELDDQKSGEIIHWRKRWAELENEHLEKAGHKARVDCRTLEAQRSGALERGDTEAAAELERLPGAHMGPDVMQMEKKGIATERGDLARAIAEQNAQIVDLAKERARQKAETEAKRPKDEPERQAVVAPPPVQSVGAASAATIRQQWQAEKEKQFVLIAKRAKALHAKAEKQIERHEEKIKAHNAGMPKEPTGLFGGFKRAAYDQAVIVWQEVRAGLERRWEQLQRRVDLIMGYMRKGATYELPTRGDILAEKKAATAQPELAERFREVAEKEKDERIERMRDKIEQRQKGKQQKRDLGKGGKSAGRDREDDDAAKDGKAARKQKILERFRQKSRDDRSREDDGRGGRGRGR